MSSQRLMSSQFRSLALPYGEELGFTAAEAWSIPDVADWQMAPYGHLSVGTSTLEPAVIQVQAAIRFKVGDAVMYMSKPRKGPQGLKRGIVHKVQVDDNNSFMHYKVKSAYNFRSIIDVKVDDDLTIRKPNDEDNEAHDLEMAAIQLTVSAEITSTTDPRVLEVIARNKNVPGADLSNDQLLTEQSAHFVRFGKEYKPHVSQCRNVLHCLAKLHFSEGRDDDVTEDPNYEPDKLTDDEDSSSDDEGATAAPGDAATRAKLELHFNTFTCPCNSEIGCKGIF